MSTGLSSILESNALVVLVQRLALCPLDLQDDLKAQRPSMRKRPPDRETVVAAAGHLVPIAAVALPATIRVGRAP